MNKKKIIQKAQKVKPKQAVVEAKSPSVVLQPKEKVAPVKEKAAVNIADPKRIPEAAQAKGFPIKDKATLAPMHLKKIVKPASPKNTLVKENVKKNKILDVTQENEVYFVYLKSPLEYRRHLLESSRKILYCLKSHQKLFLIRQRKLKEMGALKASVRELLYLNKKFNDKLPKYNTGFLEDTPTKDKSGPIQLKSLKATRPAGLKHERTEMDKLEESLANIEKKLRSLQ